MDKKIMEQAYMFSKEIIKKLMEDFSGKIVGSEDMNKEKIMSKLSDKPKIEDKVKETKSKHSIDKTLKATSESQGHGKAWEIDIQKEDNKLHKKNVSIKASCGMSLCMSDIRRMLKSENMDVVCIIWKQITPKIKEAIKTVVFDFDEFKETLIKDLEKCNYTLEEWFKHIDDYDNYVKDLPKEYYPNSKKLPQKQREHLIKKAKLCENIKYFQVNPKIDSKQQRVQCSINLNKLNITKTITDGGILFGKEYTKIIISSPRKRNNKVSK